MRSLPVAVSKELQAPLLETSLVFSLLVSTLAEFVAPTFARNTSLFLCSESWLMRCKMEDRELVQARLI